MVGRTIFYVEAGENWKVEWHDEPVKRENVSKDDENLSFAHKSWPVFGKQFPPEHLQPDSFFALSSR